MHCGNYYWSPLGLKTIKNNYINMKALSFIYWSKDPLSLLCLTRKILGEWNYTSMLVFRSYFTFCFITYSSNNIWYPKNYFWSCSSHNIWHMQFNNIKTHYLGMYTAHRKGCMTSQHFGTFLRPAHSPSFSKICASFSESSARTCEVNL